MNQPENIDSFYKADWITFGIRKRLHLSPLAATILWYLLYNTILLIAAIYDDIVFSRGNRIGLLNDWGWWIITLGWSAGIYIFLWFPDGIKNTIVSLLQNKVVGSSSLYPGRDEKEVLDIYIRDFYRSYSNRFWYILAFVITIPIMPSVVQSQREFVMWHTANAFSFWIVMFLYMLIFFIGITVIFRTIVVSIWFNKLFRDFDVDVKPLHPDQAGGLASLSRFSMTIVYAIVLTAITLVMGDISEALIKSKSYIDVVRQPHILVSYLYYGGAASLAFFAPLFVAHIAMKKAKNGFIAKISDQFDVEIDRIPPLLAQDNVSLKDSLSKLEELQQLHAIASKFPVWPYNAGYLARFFGAILSPLFISLISVAIEQFFR